MLYKKCTGYKSQLQPIQLFTTMTEAREYDINKAASIITVCSHKDIREMIRGDAIQSELRHAILYVADLIQATTDVFASAKARDNTHMKTARTIPAKSVIRSLPPTSYEFAVRLRLVRNELFGSPSTKPRCDANSNYKQEECPK